jgi:hypothetical protein
MKTITPTLIYVLLIVILNIRTKVSTLIGNSRGMRRPIGSRFKSGRFMRSFLMIEQVNDYLMIEQINDYLMIELNIEYDLLIIVINYD